MDLYTLTDQFLADQVIDQYVSAIWTERYSSAGDVQLVVPANAKTMTILADGTFLALRGSREVMELQTQSIEDNLMTVVGNTLPGFLNERVSWFKNPAHDTDSTAPKVVDFSETNTVGEFLVNVVEMMVIDPVAFSGDYISANLDWELDTIPHLEIGEVDTTGDVTRLTMPTGSLYEGIEQLATKAHVGFSLYLESADPIAGYTLVFTTYRGKDRTSDQSTYPLVRLSPDMDSLSDLKEIRSRANYKNVVYVYYEGEISTHYAEPTMPIPEGFDRRVMVTDAEGAPVGRKQQSPSGPWGPGWVDIVVGPTEIAAFREQHAKDALANHNYILAIDGQTSPINDYKYGVDYGLGDIIELEGISGAISKARITEYIRSEDATGEREYPTISVLGGSG